MDDGLLYGTPEAMKWSLDLIERLELISGLTLKWTKMSVHALNGASAQMCRKLVPTSVEVVENVEMNFVYLKTPMGIDNFVETYLAKKLTPLKTEINSLSEMTHLHECFFHSCEVVHLHAK